MRVLVESITERRLEVSVVAELRSRGWARAPEERVLTLSGLAEPRRASKEPALELRAVAEVRPGLKEPLLVEPVIPGAARPRLAAAGPDIKPTSASMAIKRMQVLRAMSHLSFGLYIEIAIFARPKFRYA